MDVDVTARLINPQRVDPLMWVFDTRTEEVVDMNAAAAMFRSRYECTLLPRTVASEKHMEIARDVAATGRPATVTEWVKYDGSWHKLVRSTSRAESHCVLEVSVDITHLDPLSTWLSRVDINKRRINTAWDTSISFNEFAVLHMLVKGMPHKNIARLLNISTKTVEYRIGKLKLALKASSTVDMMTIVASSGLIHLAMVPFDREAFTLTETGLYQKFQD